MVIMLKQTATQENIGQLRELLRQEGLEGRLVDGREERVMNVIGDETTKNEFFETLKNLPYVSFAQPIMKPYKVISRDTHPDYNGLIVNGSWKSKEIRAGREEQLIVGGDNKLALIVGPCSINKNDPIVLDEMAAQAKELGAKGLRGSGFKPRTDPYTFRGHGIEALELGRRAADKYGLAFVSEVVRTEQIDPILEYVDVLQIGTRSANQGFYLDVAEKTLEWQTPILAKRGMSQDLLKEFLPLVLNIYDYNEKGGNTNVMLCLRGIKTWDNATRYTLDAGDVPVLKHENILPVVGDPSHSAGLKRYVVPHAKAMIASGVDGLVVEIYPDGKKPLSDAAQAIGYKELREIVSFAKQIGRM